MAAKYTTCLTVVEGAKENDEMESTVRQLHTHERNIKQFDNTVFELTRHQPERSLGQNVRDVMTHESVRLHLGPIYKPEVQNCKDIHVEGRASTTEV